MELLDSQKDCAKLYLCQVATINEEVIYPYLLICLHFFVYIYLFTLTEHAERRKRIARISKGSERKSEI